MPAMVGYLNHWATAALSDMGWRLASRAICRKNSPKAPDEGERILEKSRVTNVGIDSKRAPSVPNASTLSITPRRSSSRDV
ncbi:hypothetical protein TNCV_2030331 [Trichonephila clavipes]|nr:hypothetical protein TNCV_2030331 [Trichonephila clavipes]